MNRTTLAATAAAVLLLLTGCTAESDETEAAPAPITSERVAEPAETVATPTPAAPTPVEVSTTPAPPTKATAVLTAIQLTVASYGVDVMADQIKTASDYTCDQLAAGVDEESIFCLLYTSPSPRD